MYTVPLFLVYHQSMKAPVMYGKFHILFVISAYSISCFLAMQLKQVDKERRNHILSFIGWILIVAEIYKQWYLTFVIHKGTYDWFHFPFQLCSLPMYLCVSLPHMHSHKKGILCFLSCFGLFAASFAFAYPQDMLSNDLFLLLHSFLYHGVMLFISLWIFMSEKMEWKDFKEAVKIFLISAGIAEGINIISKLLNGNADMFYISPFQPCMQPVFKEIAKYAGRPFEILFYLACIIGANTLIFYIYRIITNHKKI